MPINFTLNAILILALGVVFLIGAGYFLLNPFTRVMGIGMLATASGCICCGLTDGFTDVSPRGQLLRRLGIISFIVGLPIVGYSAYRYL